LEKTILIASLQGALSNNQYHHTEMSRLQKEFLTAKLQAQDGLDSIHLEALLVDLQVLLVFSLLDSGLPKKEFVVLSQRWLAQHGSIEMDGLID
jgi:hypothetical protein